MFRHSGWRRSRRAVAESLLRTGQTRNRIESFVDCGSHAYVLRSIDDPSQYRIAGSCCRDRFCLPCATERATIIGQAVREHIEDRPVRFLTLTVHATREHALKERLQHLYAAFQRLRRRKLWIKHVDGGVAFTELKWSNDGGWHPHLHCLVEGRYFPRKDLQKAWRACTADSFVVDIRMPANTREVAAYVTKYASKPFNRSFIHAPNQMDEAIVALAGRKLAITFGSWRGVNLTELPSSGEWEHVCSLEIMIKRAAGGDPEARGIMQAITSRDLTELYERAPPLPVTAPSVPRRNDQLTFFGTWEVDGSFKFRLP